MSRSIQAQNVPTHACGQGPAEDWDRKSLSLKFARTSLLLLASPPRSSLLISVPLKANLEETNTLYTWDLFYVLSYMQKIRRYWLRVKGERGQYSKNMSEVSRAAQYTNNSQAFSVSAH